MVKQHRFQSDTNTAYDTVYDIFAKKLREAREEARHVVEKHNFLDDGNSIISKAVKAAAMNVTDPIDAGRYSLSDGSAIHRKKTDPAIPALMLKNRNTGHAR